MDRADKHAHERAWVARERRLSRRHAILVHMFYGANKSKTAPDYDLEDFIDVKDADDATG